MDTLTTAYGMITGVSSAAYYGSGGIKICRLDTPNSISTPYGIFVPQYEDDDARRKHNKSLTFYQSGKLESISLQRQQAIQTSLGVIPAELIIFYESGSIKRIFPLNGKISAFWSEDEEHALAQAIELQLPFGMITQKIVGAYFYEDGSVKSLTFWTGDTIAVSGPIGTLAVQTGLSFYQNGAIKSLEPAHPIIVATPIGKITAFNVNVLGVHGDTNSLRFNQDGSIQALMTSSDQIAITDAEGKQHIVRPGVQPGLCDDSTLEPAPLLIEFDAQFVRFNKGAGGIYDITQHTFTVGNIPLRAEHELRLYACAS